MSEYRYCHGNKCHEYETQNRIRGVKGNKVLRTRKIKIDNWNRNNWHGYFCDERCRSDYMQKHLQTIMNIQPVEQPLETAIEIEKETVNHGWGDTTYININKIAS